MFIAVAHLPGEPSALPPFDQHHGPLRKKIHIACFLVFLALPFTNLRGRPEEGRTCRPDQLRLGRRDRMSFIMPYRAAP